MFPSRRTTTFGGPKFKDDWSFELNSDDSNDSMTVDDTYQDILRDSFSIVLWLKPVEGQPGSVEVFCGVKKDANHWFYVGLTAVGNLRYYHKSDGAGSNKESGEVFAAGASNWVQLVFSIEKNAAAGCKYYKDGVFLESDNTNGINDTEWAAFDCNSLDFIIGGYNPGSGTAINTFDGKYSEFAIYNKALSANEVKTIYNGREPFNHKDWSGAPNCKGWFRFGDGNESGSGTTIYDMSGEGNNGTLINSEAGDLQGDTP